MRGNQNNKQLSWLIFYDEILYQALTTMAYILFISKDRRRTSEERVKKIKEIFKDYQDGFDKYSDWFHTQYFFRLDTAFEYLDGVEENYEEFYRGTLKITVWKN